MTHKQYRYKDRIDEVARAKNRTKSRVRSKVEHVFGVMKEPRADSKRAYPRYHCRGRSPGYRTGYTFRESGVSTSSFIAIAGRVCFNSFQRFCLPNTTSAGLSRKQAEIFSQLDLERLPRHVAIIMDGNGRWAKRRHLPRIAGHRAGANSVRDVVQTASRRQDSLAHPLRLLRRELEAPP